MYKISNLILSLSVSLSIGISSVWATDYYVSNSGLDTNSGTSESVPWATLSKVNNSSIAPGDTIYFKRGDIWRGQLIPSCGTSGSPVTYTAYGDSDEAKPLLLGSKEANSQDVWTNEGSNIWSLAQPVETGSELLTNPSFDTGTTSWWIWYESGASVTMGRTTSVYDSSPASLQASCTNSGILSHHIQLITSPGLAITSGTYYKLSFRAKCTSVFTIPSIKIMKNSSPYTLYSSENSNWSPTITTSWATYTIYYKATATATDGRITFYLGGAIPAGSTFYLDTLSFKALTGPVLMIEDPTLGTDIGNIIFDNSICSVKVWNETDLDEQNEFWYDETNKTVKVYSTANPASLYNDIELAQGKHIIPVYDTNYVNIGNLALAYGGSHGIQLSNASFINITHCDIYYMGGSHWGVGENRYGNGIEIWCDGHDITIEYCHLWEIYDTALTNQGNVMNTQYNINYRYNQIEKCNSAYEVWDRPSTSIMYDIYFQYNTCWDNGSWSLLQRLSSTDAFLAFGTCSANIPGYIYIKNNIFAKPGYCTIFWRMPWANPDHVVMTDNTYYQMAGSSMILLYDMDTGGSTHYYASEASFAQYKADTGREENSLLNPICSIADSLTDPGFEGTHNSPYQGLVNPVYGGAWINGWAEIYGGTDSFDFYQDAGERVVESANRYGIASEGESALRMFASSNSTNWNGIKSTSSITLYPCATYRMYFRVSRDTDVDVYDHLTVNFVADGTVYGEKTYYFVSSTTPTGETATQLTAGRWTTLCYEYTYTGSDVVNGYVGFYGYRQSDKTCSLYIDAISDYPNGDISCYLSDPGFEGTHTSPYEVIPYNSNLNGWTETFSSSVFDFYQDEGGTKAGIGSGTAEDAFEGSSYMRSFVWGNSTTWNGISIYSAAIPLVPGNTYQMSFWVTYDTTALVMDKLTIYLLGNIDGQSYGNNIWYFVENTTPSGATTTTLTAGTWTCLTYSFTYTGTVVQNAYLRFRMNRQTDTSVTLGWKPSTLYIDAIETVNCSSQSSGQSCSVSGDANLDGAVDVGDLGILAANYGGSDKTWAQGDFNNDKLVDVGDLGILAANYGTGSSSTLSWEEAYAQAFGITSDVMNEASDDFADTDDAITSSACSSLGLSLIACLALMGLMMIELE